MRGSESAFTAIELNGLERENAVRPIGMHRVCTFHHVKSRQFRGAIHAHFMITGGEYELAEPLCDEPSVEGP